MEATNDTISKLPSDSRWWFLSLALVLAVCLPAPLHFFESFPNGWDQAEYVWCVKDGFLPHSPYVAFVLIGRAVASVLPPAVALSAISLTSGLAALVLLGVIVARLSAAASEAATHAEAVREGRIVGLVAALLLGTSTVFVRHAATQEVYALQVCAVLAAMALLTSTYRSRFLCGGLIYGCALAVHNGSILVLPALLWLLASRGRVASPARDFGVWLLGAVAMVGVVYAFVGWNLPADDGRWLSALLGYLGGLRPDLQLGALFEVDYLLDSAASIAHRIIDADIGVTRGPLATGPVGASVVSVAAAGVGLLHLLRGAGGRLTAGFWLVFAIPFLLYELVIGWNLDYGTYLVFVVPPLCALSAQSAGWLTRLPTMTQASAVLMALAALTAPSISQIADHWNDIDADRRNHDSPATLAAVFAAGVLPDDAVVIQPRSEWNANLLPLYSERRHVARTGATLRLLRSRAPFTAMNPDAFDMLTTDRLVDLLRDGHPVIAFERTPLRGANPGQLDAALFAWLPAGEVDLAAAASTLGLSNERIAALERRSMTMYRAQLVALYSDPSVEQRVE